MDFNEGTFSTALPSWESPQLRCISKRLVATASFPFDGIACLIHWFHIVSLLLKCCVVQKQGETFEAALLMLFLPFLLDWRVWVAFFFPCWVMPFWCYTGADCTCCLWVLLFHWPRCIAKQNPGQSGITECCQKQLIVICVEEHIEINNPSASRHAIQATVMWEEIVLRKKKDYLPPINQIRKASQIMKRIQNALSYDNVFVWLKKERLYYRDNYIIVFIGECQSFKMNWKQTEESVS